MSGEVRMTRSRAKRQQARQVRIFDEVWNFLIKMFLVIGISMMMMHARGWWWWISTTRHWAKQVERHLPAGQSLLSFWEIAAATAQWLVSWKQLCLFQLIQALTALTPHQVIIVHLTVAFYHSVPCKLWRFNVCLIHGTNPPTVPLFQHFQLEDVGAGDMETVEASSSDELSSKTNGSIIDSSLNAEEGLR